MSNFWGAYQSAGRFILRVIIRGFIAKKLKMKDSVISNIIQDMIGNMLKARSKLAYKVYTIATAFGSIGGILALIFFDMADRNIDGYYSLRVSRWGVTFI